MTGGDLLAQGLADGPDSVLGQLVYARAGADASPRHRADVDQSPRPGAVGARCSER
jgi:hypothetical protein